MSAEVTQDRPPNFRNEDGKLYLVRCFACEPFRGRENYVLAVSDGTCAWCGWADDWALAGLGADPATQGKATAGGTASGGASSDPDEYDLCGECGTISPTAQWQALDADPLGADGQGLRIVVAKGHEPSFWECPACRYLHRDDDADPGVWSGTLEEMEAERASLTDTEPPATPAASPGSPVVSGEET